MPKLELQDALKAEVVEITVDDTGKLWVNVDGRCVLRIGHCDSVIAENNLTRHQLIIDFEGDW